MLAYSLCFAKNVSKCLKKISNESNAHYMIFYATKFKVADVHSLLRAVYRLAIMSENCMHYGIICKTG